MELTFEVTKEDLIAARIFRGRTDKKSSRRRLILPLALVAGAIFWFVVVPFKMPSSLDELTVNIGLYLEMLAVILAFLGGCILLLLGGLRRKFAENRIHGSFESFHKRWLLGEQKLILDASGVTLVNSQEYKYPWPSIIQAGESDSHLFIYPYGAQYDVAIPKKELPAGTDGQIVNILKTHNVNILREE
ncbi:MAG: hypothetical protein LIO77_03740 [Rikenellaceae bacterium]|nr:hypothetical protein [Rikenellaceae bacterium]